MSNFLYILCICFFALEPEIKADTCNTLQLGPKEKLLVTIFDQNYVASDGQLWDNLCKVIKEFPRGLISMEYRPGALATGTKKSIKCGYSDCHVDQYHACEMMFYKNFNDCYKDIEGGPEALLSTILCYCNQDSNNVLLENAGLRASWNVPDFVLPALAFNKVYDPCAKTSTHDDIKKYLCQVYQNKVGPCS